MSNYPNMSYCMVENTLLALQQVLNAMDMEGVEFLQELSDSERRAFGALAQAAQAFAEQAEELQEEFDGYDSDYDGQPDEAQEWYDFDPEA